MNRSTEREMSTGHAVPVPFHAKEGNDCSVLTLCSCTKTKHIWYQNFQQKPGFFTAPKAKNSGQNTDRQAPSMRKESEVFGPT